MNWATMIVLIVLIAVVGRIITARQRRMTDTPGEDAEKAALRREVGELRQRIATLERIATDGPSRLRREIDALNGTDETQASKKDL